MPTDRKAPPYNIVLLSPGGGIQTTYCPACGGRADGTMDRGRYDGMWNGIPVNFQSEVVLSEI
jgi:hypothetical protein